MLNKINPIFDEEKAIYELEKNNYSCVVIKDDELFFANGIGVKPIINWLKQSPTFFNNAIVADKVIGKAAALLLILGKAKFVYGDVMSSHAIEIFKMFKINYRYKTLVHFIENRDKTDMCPLEQSVININDPVEAYAAITLKIEQLMRK